MSRAAMQQAIDALELCDAEDAAPGLFEQDLQVFIEATLIPSSRLYAGEGIN